MENVELDKDLLSLPKEKWREDDYVVQIGGFWFLPQFVEPIKRVINHFNPLPSDVILATSPKAGTTWLKSLVYSILNRSSKDKLAVKHPHVLVPFLEVPLLAQSDEPPTPRRLFATHVPYQLLAKTLDSCECKVVYLTRNPKDTINSIWHFVSRWNARKQWSLDEATNVFCRGVFPYGPYYDHVIGYRDLSLKRPETVMLVTFEEMIQDPHGHVKKLGDFLGCPVEDEDEVEEIVKNCSIEVLSSHDCNKSEELATWFPLPYDSYFRKGKIGDYKNYLSDESIQRIDSLTKQRFHSLGYEYGI